MKPVRHELLIFHILKFNSSSARTPTHFVLSPEERIYWIHRLIYYTQVLDSCCLDILNTHESFCIISLHQLQAVDICAVICSLCLCVCVLAHTLLQPQCHMCCLQWPEPLDLSLPAAASYNIFFTCCCSAFLFVDLSLFSFIYCFQLTLFLFIMEPEPLVCQEQFCMVSEQKPLLKRRIDHLEGSMFGRACFSRLSSKHVMQHLYYIRIWT